VRVVIAGGHGKIALILERMLAERGDAVAGLIRNPDQAQDLHDAGAEPVVVDLENATLEDVTEHLRGADAVVFAAGAGAGSGLARKQTVDRDAAILLADAAEAAGVARYLMISSRGADKAPREGTDPVFVAYLRAKAEADQAVRSRTSLDTTIVRPGALTDDPGTGSVAIAAATGRGSIPREDVAALLVALLDTPKSAGQTFEVIAGDTPISEAVSSLVSG
jgi:uncharacterized protein YbjT (DUF2867 family)